jgi:hypothetical protein
MCFISVTAYEPRQAFAYRAQIQPPNAYSLSLPAGSYQMTYSINCQGPVSGNLQAVPWFVRNTYDSLDVCGDQVHDVALPPFPATRQQAITVGSLAPWTDGVAGITLWMIDAQRTVGFAMMVTSRGITTDPAAFMMDLPDDALIPYLTVEHSIDMFDTVRVDGVQSPSGYTVTIPPLARISGNVAFPSAPILATTGGMGARVECLSSAPDEQSHEPDCATNPGSCVAPREGSWIFPAAGAYQMFVRRGVTCSLHAEFSFWSSPSGIDPLPAIANALAGELIDTDLVRDFSLPAYTSASFAPTIVDARGATLNVFAQLWSTALSGAALNGNVVEVRGLPFSVPSGTYQIILR